ncbi:OmpA family protein [Bradyrhizobium neotropicale]|uniref:OmpA family protein n=1 Tax=Bradyrhizobium neotropicale TaxID=1497615 RepID=UPI001AD65F21|nr:OmpA family protein [Bradyrhizobium neotropicale]MBO4226640.1 OmpA family protein [Bradyrhizobium neotropicale]
MKATNVHLWGAIILWSGLNFSGVQAADLEAGAADRWRCEPAKVAVEYISSDDLHRLRQSSREFLREIAFSQMSLENGTVVAEALRIGSARAFAAARILRDLVIIQALDRQTRCKSARCEKPAIISQFKINDSTTPEHEWAKIRDLWMERRDDDASAARSCLELWKTLPDATEAAVAEAAKLPPELAGLEPAEIRFCLPKLANSSNDTSEVSDEQVQQLRSDYRQRSEVILAGMNPKYMEPLEEALRVGPKAGYFAHRALRNLVIVKEMETQKTCPAGWSCPLTDDIRVLKRSDSWPETLSIWKSVRDTDLQRSLVCMKYSKTLPTYELPVEVASVKYLEGNDRAACNASYVRQPILVHFKKNRSILDEDQVEKLAEAVSLLKACPEIGVFVTGYADPDGRRSFNGSLSKARAASVEAHLVQNGVMREQIDARGKGVAQGSSKRSSQLSKAYDRRAEVRLGKLIEGKLR